MARAHGTGDSESDGNEVLVCMDETSKQLPDSREGMLFAPFTVAVVRSPSATLHRMSHH